ncbi:CHY zinc finger [Micractinium conductrix]|uniref:CHY zinc finger n=1 Tax=Micractinium conductrix TaxID=554055 RepID=A0A2P6VBI8_9CHLO|nr:CHY zinc finger [Micractinium conductrix]|eukprot:PSC71454.1 CHY zinc finger [Micractinium conductrix]
MEEQRLQQLQAELLQLKQRVPGIHLRRSTAAQSPVAPFPITASAEVAARAAAERYDVSSFSLSVRLRPGVLSGGGGEQLASAVEVVVEGAELPRALRQAMSAELHAAWVGTGPAPGALNLAHLWERAAQRFVHLITLLPEALESYQFEDASGSTVRRWAVLSDESSLTIDASAHPAAVPAKPQGASLAQAAAAAATPSTGRPAQAAAAAGAAPFQPPSLQRLPGCPAEAGAELPRALQQELTFLQRRYGLRMLPPGEAAVAAAAAQLAGMQLAAGSGASSDGTAARRAAAGEAAAPAALELAAPEPAAAAAAAAFEVELQPTDPAWVPATHPPRMCLHGWAASSYPAPRSLTLVASPGQAQLSALHREVLDKLLAAEVAAAVAAAAAAPRPAPLSAAVRHVANHAGELWQQSEDIAVEVARRRQRQQQQQGRQGEAASAQHGGPPPAGGSSSDGGSSELDDDGAWGGSYASGSNSEGSGSDFEGAPASVEGRDVATRGGGGGGAGGHSEAQLPLALQLEELELEVDCLEALKLTLQVLCSRCRAPGELTFASAAVALPADATAASRRGTLAAAAECGKCHAEMRVDLAPKLAHGYSNTLAHVRAEGCTPVDLLPSMLAGQCPQCSGSAAFRSVVVGRWNERQCTACHTPMRFQFSSALFVPLRRPSGPRGGAAGGDGAAQQGAGPRSHGSGAAAAVEFNGLLTPGQPLPDRGACRHYRHSYRWLRFPCCGKRFPCDLCHEELTDGHDMKWATRMVCGYCSIEQPVAAECKACGKKLAASASAPTGRHTRFWEGGKGQRDPNKLHPGDPRRHRGRYKTKSAKHKRVGQKGKEKGDK